MSLTADQVGRQTLGSFAGVLGAVIEPRAEGGGLPAARTHGGDSGSTARQRDLLPLRVSLEPRWADCYRDTPRYAKLAAEGDSHGRRAVSAPSAELDNWLRLILVALNTLHVRGGPRAPRADRCHRRGDGSGRAAGTPTASQIEAFWHFERQVESFLRDRGGVLPAGVSGCLPVHPQPYLRRRRGATRGHHHLGAGAAWPAS